MERSDRGVRQGNWSPLPRQSYIDPVTGSGPGMANLTEVEWNLMTVTSRLLFAWEGNCLPMEQRPAEFDKDTTAAVKGTLKQRLGEFSVKNLVESHDPMLLLARFAAEDIEHLDIAKRWGGSQQLLVIMEARALVWLATQPRDTSKKILQFRVLTPEQFDFVNKVNPWGKR